jgi:hypothetical protein
MPADTPQFIRLANCDMPGIRSHGQQSREGFLMITVSKTASQRHCQSDIKDETRVGEFVVRDMTACVGIRYRALGPARPPVE